MQLRHGFGYIAKTISVSLYKRPNPFPGWMA